MPVMRLTAVHLGQKKDFIAVSSPTKKYKTVTVYLHIYFQLVQWINPPKTYSDD